MAVTHLDQSKLDASIMCFRGSHMYVLYYILDLIYGEKHVYVLYIHFLYWYLVLYLKCMSKHGKILWSLVAD